MASVARLSHERPAWRSMFVSRLPIRPASAEARSSCDSKTLRSAKAFLIPLLTPVHAVFETPANIAAHSVPSPTIARKARTLAGTRCSASVNGSAEGNKRGFKAEDVDPPARLALTFSLF